MFLADTARAILVASPEICNVRNFEFLDGNIFLCVSICQKYHIVPVVLMGCGDSCNNLQWSICFMGVIVASEIRATINSYVIFSHVDLFWYEIFKNKKSL